MRRLRVFAVFFIFSTGYFSTWASCEPLGTVFVSILPQKFFVEQICRESVAVEVMVAPGASPHTYEPRPSQMIRLAQAKAYFAIGLPFESTWLDKFIAVNPHLKVVHTDDGIERLAMVEHHEAVKDAEEEHGHEGLDPHIWLSPLLVKKQVEAIEKALSEMFPAKAPFFKQNLAMFTAQIDTLDGELRASLKTKKGLRFMVFHPSWGYFARDYGLEQVAVEVEGKEPKPSQLQHLIKNAREQKIRIIFAQPQFSMKSARLLAGEISGEVVMLDPLAENWLENMRQVAEKLGSALK